MTKPLPWLHWAVLLIVMLVGVSCCRQRQVEDSFKYKIAVIGNLANVGICYDESQMQALCGVGFNALQLNIARGFRALFHFGAPHMDSLYKILTLEQIAKEVDAVGGVNQIAGIKEYFGLTPNNDDSNQLMDGITWCNLTSANHSTPLACLTDKENKILKITILNVH